MVRSPTGPAGDHDQAAMEALGVERIEAVADRAPYKIEACEAVGITAHVPEPVRGPAMREGFFAKEQFRSASAKDAFTCPGGQILRRCRRGRLRDNVKVHQSSREACMGRPLRTRRTRADRHTSHVWRSRPPWTARPCGKQPAPSSPIGAGPASSIPSARPGSG